MKYKTSLCLALTTLLTSVLGAPLQETSEAQLHAHLADLKDTLTFSNMTAYNKGVHFDPKTGQEFQLFTMQEDQHPHHAIRSFIDSYSTDDEEHLSKRAHTPSNAGPAEYWDRACKPNMPCPNDLENKPLPFQPGNVVADVTEAGNIAFCRPWQQIAGDDISWEYRYNYHQCGINAVPFAWMYKYGMRNTSDLTLELVSKVFNGNAEWRPLTKPRSICLHDLNWGRFCFSWSGIWHDDWRNHTASMTLPDMFVFHGMSMMCLHNGYSASGDVKMREHPTNIALCVSDRPDQCADNICLDNFQVRVNQRNAAFAGGWAMRKMIDGGDGKGGRVDYNVRPELCKDVTGSMGSRRPFLMSNETIKWILPAKRDVERTTPPIRGSPMGDWETDTFSQLRYSKIGPGTAYRNCFDEDWPIEDVWC